jgi:hypothetical protein
MITIFIDLQENGVLLKNQYFDPFVHKLAVIEVNTAIFCPNSYYPLA